MKLIVILLAVFAMGAKVQSGMPSKEVVEKCAKENGITAETFNNEKDTDTASKQTKCTLACIYQEFLNEDGSPNFDKINEKMSGKPQGLEIVKECAASIPKGGDKCETTFALARCVIKKFKKDGQ